LLGLVPGLEVGEEALWAVSAYSQGYPYLMQLVGYHLVRYLDELYPVGEVHLLPAHMEAVEDKVYGAYRDDVLVPSTRSLGSEARAYLQAMARLLDKEGRAPTGQVARELGKTLSQLSSCRQDLINRRLVRAAGYGKVRFALPHLSRFALEQQPVQSDISPREWPTR